MMIEFEKAVSLVPERYVHNLKRIIERTKHDRDHFIMIVAREGEGKSSFAQISGALIAGLQNNPECWKLEHNVYDVQSMMSRAHKIPYHGALNCDEGTAIFFRGDAQSREGKERIKFLTTCRSKRLIWFVCVTESGFCRIDPMLIQDRCENLIRIPKRGRMHWYSKDKLRQIWIDDKTRKVKRWGEPNWTGSWKKMPKAAFKEYEDWKHKALSGVGEDDDEEPKFYVTLNKYARMRGYSRTWGWRHKEELGAVQLPNSEWGIPMEKYEEDKKKFGNNHIKVVRTKK